MHIKGIHINNNIVKTKGTSIRGKTSRGVMKSITIRPKGIEAMERFFSIWTECQTVKNLDVFSQGESTILI